MEGFNQIHPWYYELKNDVEKPQSTNKTHPLSRHKNQKTINVIAYHRGAALVRLHPTGFYTALIPLLETTKQMHHTHKQPHKQRPNVIF